MFPSNNVWNTRIDALPVDANSDTYVGTIGPSSPLHPDYGAGGGIPYTLVPGTQPKVSVAFRYGSDPGPYPIPPDILMEGGADNHALIVDTDNCMLYELFALGQSGGSWTAGSGAIFNLNSNALRPDGWTSADAAGLAILPGLVRYDEVISGQINHAIRFTAPQTRNTYIWPARHAASALTGSQFPQFGQRFRLKASYDISRYPLHVQTILQAMKTYGIILADNGAPWHIAGVGDSRWNDDEMHQMTQVSGDDFEAVDESSLMVDPNSGQAATPGSNPPPPSPPPPAPPPSDPSIPTGYVNVVSRNSGKCLDVTGGPSAASRGVLLQQWTCLGSTNQNFEFTAVNGGYRITAQNSLLQLDIRGGPSAVYNGALLQQWSFWGASNEIFSVAQSSDGYFTIKPLSSGSCLDVKSISQSNGASIQQWSCTGGANQEWSFVPAS